MISDGLVLTAERLRDDLAALRDVIKARYASPTSQVRAAEVKDHVARLAETWLVELSGDVGVRAILDSNYLGDLNVHFQRLLNFSEAAAQRKSYEQEIKAILKDYKLRLIIPLKQARGAESQPTPLARPTIAELPAEGQPLTAFVGQSFAETDRHINETFRATLEAIGVLVVTGERPKSDRISNKVKGRIDTADVFLGIFTRRDKIARKTKWTTSTWVVEEKAYAVGKGKRLILLRENGVDSIGGLQGDYEYIEFDRETLADAVIRLLLMFDIRAEGLA